MSSEPSPPRTPNPRLIPRVFTASQGRKFGIHSKESAERRAAERGPRSPAVLTRRAHLYPALANSNSTASSSSDPPSSPSKRARRRANLQAKAAFRARAANPGGLAAVRRSSRSTRRTRKLIESGYAEGGALDSQTDSQQWLDNGALMPSPEGELQPSDLFSDEGSSDAEPDVQEHVDQPVQTDVEQEEVAHILDNECDSTFVNDAMEVDSEEAKEKLESPVKPQLDKWERPEDHFDAMKKSIAFMERWYAGQNQFDENLSYAHEHSNDLLISLSEVQDQLQVSEAALESSKQENNALTERVAEQLAQANHYMSRMKDLQDTNYDYSAKIDDLEGDVDDFKGVISSLENQVAELKKENLSFREREASASGRLHDVEATLRELENAVKVAFGRASSSTGR